MITVFGEGRGFRVVWLLEEMGIQDGDVTVVESIAIVEYLMARYGPTQLAPDPRDPAFPAYQQFLHLGEAGLAASIYFVVSARNIAPEAQRQNWSAGQAQRGNLSDRVDRSCREAPDRGRGAQARSIGCSESARRMTCPNRSVVHSCRARSRQAF